jgi:hypothetical protein
MTNVNLIVEKQKNKDGKAGERKKHDLYPTPYDVLMAIAYEWHWKEAKHILDVGAGDGRFGREFGYYCSSLETKTGVEIRDVKQPNDFQYWYQIDYTKPVFTYLMAQNQFDYIVGNPPFKFAEGIIRVAFTQLLEGGRILMLLPSDFSHGAKRSSGLFTEYPPYRQIHIADRIDFTQSGNPHQNMALFEWRKNHKGFLGNPKEWLSVTWEWQSVYNMMKTENKLTKSI